MHWFFCCKTPEIWLGKFLQTSGGCTPCILTVSCRMKTVWASQRHLTGHSGHTALHYVGLWPDPAWLILCNKKVWKKNQLSNSAPILSHRWFLLLKHKPAMWQVKKKKTKRKQADIGANTQTSRTVWNWYEGKTNEKIPECLKKKAHFTSKGKYSITIRKSCYFSASFVWCQAVIKLFEIKLVATVKIFFLWPTCHLHEIMWNWPWQLNTT